MKNKLFYLIPLIMLIFAILPLPYGYYTLLKLVISLSSILIIFQIYKRYYEVNNLIIIFSIIFLIYNPVFPIYLNKTIWIPINILTALAYLYLIKIEKIINLRKLINSSQSKNE